MPLTGANTMVKDPEYCNWLKVGLALYYLKDGLSSFIQDEVDAMHTFIVQKLYNASTVPAPLCSSCNAKDVKQNRNTYIWKFKSRCPISLCDTWLTELLALCTNPTSSKLYCENCIVTAWPNSPWECAKFYMPRGQTVNNTGPAQSDSQALLTLMANCKHFNSKLSPGGIQLTHTVSKIRNTVMHSGDMRLSDNDRTSFITDIIKFLEDPCHLKSLDECKKAVLEINKINTDSLKVFFNTDMEMEMKALSACVQDLRQELGVHTVETEKTVEFLKEEIKDLLKEMKDRVEDIDNKCQKMDAEFKQFSRTVTLDLKNVKGQFRTQRATCSLVKKNVNILKRKTLTGLSQQRRMVRKLEKDMQLIKGRDSQASGVTADVRDIQLLFIKAYESVQIISVNAVLDNAFYWKDLEDFYTDIVIEEEDEESSPRIKNEQQLKKAVTSFRQIFEKYDRKVTRIILKAPAGQGKSTFCRKVVQTWCSVQKKRLNIPIDVGISDSSETSGLKHEDEMLCFDVLLYICLRDISDEKTLMDVVYSQFPLDETQDHKSHIEALIAKAEDNKVLLIMDGLDEMVNSSSFIDKILQKRLYPNLTVLATTRPWKVGELRLIRSAHIDLLLDLRGFNFDNSMLFAKRMFDKYYNDESAIAQFEEDILKNNVIRSLIHVPLLLLFIVQVWYDMKSFPQTIHELYLEMFDVIVNRYMEDKERIGKNWGRQDQKIQFLRKECVKESTTFNANPKLSKLSLVKHFGADFLAALCEVANHFLIKACGETTLVFEEEVLLELLGKEGTSVLQAALDMGILSKSESRGTFKKNICLTFLHKTVQEFLAAINICCREDRCNMFLDSLKTFGDVVKNEQIIKFAAGISTNQCQKIFEKIYEVCDKDRLEEYRMRDISRLYKDCIREARKEALSLKLYCIYANDQTVWNELQSALKNTLKFRIQLKYLYLQSCTLNDAELDFFEFQCLTKIKLVHMTINGKLLVSKCTHLKCLDLDSCTLDDDVWDVSESICLEYLSLKNVTMKGKLLLSKCTYLKCLYLNKCALDNDVLDLSESICLEDIRLSNVTTKGKLFLSQCTHLKCLYLNKCALDDDVLDLSESICLENIRLRNVTMKGKLLLSKCTHLKCLNLKNCTLDDDVLDLSESICLEDIILQNVTMKGKLLLSKCTHLKCLNLKYCTLDDDVLDLSESICLEDIRLQNVTMKGKLMLSMCTHLKFLYLNKCILDDDVVDLSESICLEHIVLKNVTMKGNLLLSQCTHLRYLTLSNCTLDEDELDFTEAICLENLSLENVTMKGKLLLSKCTHLKRLDLSNCTLGSYVLDFSEAICLEHLSLTNVTIKGKLSLSKCTHLKYLILDSCILELTVFDLSECTCLERLFCNNVSPTGRCRLMCTRVKDLILLNCNLAEVTLDLSTCPINRFPQLQSTSMENADLNDALLTLDNVNNCMNLTLDNVIMSKECKEVFYNSLSHRKMLQRLSIKNVDLCDALLSFVCVKCVTLDNVIMSKGCKEVFCKCLSQCKTLQSLSIKNMNLCDALLSLDSENYFYEVNLDNVTMSKECTEVFCKSLSQYIELEKLSIRNVDLCDALLSLVSVKFVIIDNVTMSNECKEMFCNSLSQCKGLERLSIRNVDLCNALLSLVSVRYVSLDNVTMSKECKEVFCKSLSQCKGLEGVSIKKLDLCDALLRFDKENYIGELNLDNVTMSKKCKEMLCKSLFQFQGLNRLSIKNMDLCDVLLIFDSVYYVNLDNVTMSKECKAAICKSLSQNKKLWELSIQNMDLCDALLIFDSENYLYELNLDNVTMSKECKDAFCKSLYQCKVLDKLSIKNVDLCDALLRLVSVKFVNLDNVTMSKECKDAFCKSLYQCKVLDKLSIKNVDLCDALLRLVSVKFVNLDNVTMSKECKDVFCTSLSQCQKLWILSLKNVDLCDALLRLVNVKYVSLDNVTMSKECKDAFCKSLFQCKKLGRLSIKNVDLCDALLNLDSENYFYEVNLDNVTMSKECKDVFCTSLSQCQKLWILSLKNVDLCDALLRLVSVKYVSLDNVTMSKECKDVFCNSLSQCKGLEELSIKNVDLCDALLRLVSVKYVSLDNVTMSKECKDVFCNSLYQCKELEELSIKNVDLCDAILNLDSENYFYEVNLDNVTMSKECKDVFCTSLSQCQKLWILSLKNVDLCDALLRLVSVKYVSLDNVTMSKECKDVFCNSLSQCKGLEELSIKNVELCDELHELYNMKRLNCIALDGLQMGTLGKVMMCKSLCQCTQLENLSLKNLDLGDGLLRLDNLGILNSLTIDNVTMCKDGYVMLCSSISMCKQLSLKNLDLGNAIPSLDNLEEFELVNVTMSLECADYIKSSRQCQLSSYLKTALSIEMIANSCDKCVMNYTNKRDDDDNMDDDNLDDDDLDDYLDDLEFYMDDTFFDHFLIMNNSLFSFTES